MNLTSLMDVFTILVFFLIMNSGHTELLQSPKELALPESVVEIEAERDGRDHRQPGGGARSGRAGRAGRRHHGDGESDIEPIVARLAELQDRVIGVRTQTSAERSERGDDPRGQVDSVQHREAESCRRARRRVTRAFRSPSSRKNRPLLRRRVDLARDAT